MADHMPDDEPWRVRVLDADGGVLGAGVLLGETHVLTCAHVVPAGADHVFVDRMRGPAVRADVADEHFVPPLEDRRGDVALLDLAGPVDGAGALLRRTALPRNLVVRTVGFPRRVHDGVSVLARLAGRGGPGHEWVQLNRDSANEFPVTSGFSGAGVVDDADGSRAVIGIVVGEFANDIAHLAWMIPVETILVHLPGVARWAVGGAPLDDGFTGTPDAHVEQVGLARALAGWLDRHHSRDVVMVLVGRDREVLHRAVGLSAVESRPETNGAPEGTVPSVGSVDLAVDASSRTADQVSRRIIDRAGVGADESSTPSEQVRAGTPPMTVVVDGVDDAEQPEVLLQEVLKPLVEQGSRVVLGFRRESSPSLTAARSWELGSLTARLDRLADEIKVLAAQEELLDRHHREVDHRAAGLRMRLVRLRAALGRPDAHSVRPLLEETEVSLARALRRTGRAARVVEELLERRREAGGLLDAYQAKADGGGLVEDTGLAGLYRRAHDLLGRGLDDLALAEEAVRGYGAAVRRALGDAGRERR
ncbi:serine protease [Lentzea sp. NBRC 102530]|uniref:trypsin-like serine peptidase n=1 Tax=Lentzea sp. NBRC 102530 TaxID=3032201 RepID=UPI00249FDD82|nr:serine protease [Lentzea sp. NBRC 102530]GLY47727.1 serine protease [Lentzea sp. NBRC 102530]